MNKEIPNCGYGKTLSRRAFVTAISAITAGYSIGGKGVLAAQELPPLPVTAFNHMTLAVSDPGASVEWYQNLLGLPIVARQDNTTILQVGDGPQFIGISGNATDNPRITHYCLSVDNFDYEDAVRILAEQDVASVDASGPMQSMVRMRGPEFGGDVDGTAELYFGDPDGILVQLQDSSYCGGAGAKGEICSATPELPPNPGLLSIREFNHFTLFVSDQPRSVQFYQSLFGMPVDTYQGGLPIMRVGSGKAFLALSQQPSPSRIHHASLAVDDFDVDRIFSILEDYGLIVIGEAGGATGPLQAYVTMRGPDRGGATQGTPEVYFTDPDGILLQLQDNRYCGGNGYYGEQCGTVANPTGRNA